MLIKKTDKIELTIEKMLYEGVGLARYEGFTIFVEDSCSEDRLLVEIISVNKSFARAKIIDIIEASKYRVKPFCSLANVCGGCNWQHINYQRQLIEKKNIIEETIKKITNQNIQIKEVIQAPKTINFRHKIQYPVSQTKNSKRILTGYYKKNTHELVNIKHCPIQPVIIDEINEFIKQEAQNLQISAYSEKKHSGLLRHIVFRHSCSENNLLVIFVINDESANEKIKKLAKIIFDKYQEIIGVLVNYNQTQSNVIQGKKTDLLFGQDFYTENIENKKYKISANAFFQVNPESATNILNNVKNIIQNNCKTPKILDAYSGVGCFGVFVADIAKNVTCIEENKEACVNAIENFKLNNFNNYEILSGDATKNFANLIKEKKKFDCIIVDPPRKGLSDCGVKFLAQLTDSLLIYVSCNPTTLARDIKLFNELNFETEYIQPIDMFCHTYHIENIAVLKKGKKI